MCESSYYRVCLDTELDIGFAEPAHKNRRRLYFQIAGRARAAPNPHCRRSTAPSCESGTGSFWPLPTLNSS